MTNSLFTLIGCILLCEAVGFVGGLVTVKAVKTWYADLKKPPFNPPSYLFEPVWTVLYLLMGVSLFLILQSHGNKTIALIFFGAQLILNFFWSFIFFYWHKILYAFVEILTLFLFIIITISTFFPLNIIAALLLIPYALWVSFASILNGAIWYLNRGLTSGED